MGATFDLDVLVSVVADATSVPTAGFGVAVYAADAANLDVGFTERIRYYTSAADAAADTDLSAVEIAAVSAVFAQELHISTVGVARIEADVAQDISFDFTGTIEVDDIISITVNGIATSYTATSAVLATEVAALKALVITALAAEPVTVGGATTHITVVADVAGEPFSYTSSYIAIDAGTVVIAETVTAAGVGIESELDAVLSESDAWYSLAIYSRAEAQITRASRWTESNKRLFIAQTSDADIKTAAGTDLGTILNGLSYRRTALCWHATDAQFLDMALPGKKLQADPDVTTTTWDKTNLSGITVDSMTTTEKTNILANHANAYLPFKGTPVLSPGKTVDGLPIDLLTTTDWVAARIDEAISTEILRLANINSKVPYTDAGIQSLRALVEAVLAQGVRAGHFTQGTATVVAPRASDVSTVIKQSRRLTMSFSVEGAGAIEGVTVSGVVAVDL